MNRELTINKLASMGLDPSLTGFHYIVDLLELAPDIPADGDNMGDLYRKVAEKHGVTFTSVERTVRHAIERFYYHGGCADPTLAADRMTGKWSNKAFLYKLRIALKGDMGCFSDGRSWVLREHNIDKYDVTIYACGGCYTAFVGSHEACIKFILNGGKVNAV